VSVQEKRDRQIGGTNLEHARFHNRRTVLEIVRRAGNISRADIARQTGLTVQTISNIVGELEQTGLLVAGAPTRGGRGQPYALNPSGGWSIGIHVARHSVIGVLTDLTGAPLARHEVAATPDGPEDAVAVVRDLAGRLQREAGVQPGRTLGIGIALPARFGLGPISTAGPTGLPGWDDAEARAAFAAGLGQPVLIENDAVATAIGERLYGVARDIDSFVLLFLEDGLGAGLFLNGQPFKGAFSNAGEIGHMIVEPGGRPCPCGNRGCLERYVSLRAAYESVSADPDQETPESLAALEARDPGRLDDWITQAGHRLRSAVNILETVLDPETIILAGLASGALVDRLIAAADPLPVSVGARADRKVLRLLAGTVGHFSTAYGAAALPVFDEINPRFDVLMKG
jgi:predicted NBD/HSP70 family sugar kinase